MRQSLLFSLKPSILLIRHERTKSHVSQGGAKTPSSSILYRDLEAFHKSPTRDLSRFRDTVLQPANIIESAISSTLTTVKKESAFNMVRRQEDTQVSKFNSNQVRPP